MCDKINIIGAYYGNAGKERGADEGGRFIKTYLMQRSDVSDGGDVDRFKESTNRGSACLEEVIDVCSEINKLVTKSLNENKKTFIIGGDHSISLGSIPAAATSARILGDKFGVIYIDAHGDINTLEGSLTKNIHGMSLAACIGIGDSKMTEIANTKLDPQNLLFIATRSLEQLESDLISDKGIAVITSEQIIKTEPNLSDIFSYIDNFVISRGLKSIHLSIDIDSVDPSEAPGTGVPEPNGIKANSLESLIKHILQNFNIRSVDFVEYDPRLDIENRTKKLALKISQLIISELYSPLHPIHFYTH